MSSTQFCKPYDGSNRKLVIAMDIGTTFSGISYTILDPGEVPKVWTVTTFPGHTTSGGDSKVPSVLYYNLDGVVQAIGQEADNLRESGEAEDNEWILVEWFKLHLRPKELNATHLSEDRLPQLPPNKTITDVLADFMSYLYRCTKHYIRTSHAAGEALLQSLEGNTSFVMGHPNGWAGLQQQKMRKAAVHAGMVADMDTAGDRIQFVTEGEASLYYCLENGLSSDIIKPQSNIMIVDAGGGTIDLSSYRIKEVKPMRVEEIAPPGCRLQGSVFVNQRASAFLYDKLSGSAYDDPTDIDNIVQCFEGTVKRRFKASSEPAHIRFGTRNDNDAEYNISKGILKLTGQEVSGFFDPSLEAIIDAIQEQRTAGGDIKTIFFVGGFAASDYLFNSLRKELATSGIEISRPDGYTNKAVADGAVAFYMDHIVSTRMTRTTYGVEAHRLYNEANPDHASRSAGTFVDASGERVVPNAYFSIVCRGTKINAEQEYTYDFCLELKNCNRKFDHTTYIMTYSGTSPNPLWTDTEPDSYHTICTINSDISQAVRSLKPLHGRLGRLYYRFDYKVVLKFGLTELQAQMAWMEDGVERRSPATITYLGDV